MEEESASVQSSSQLSWISNVSIITISVGKFSKWENLKMYYFDVVDVLQMLEDQSIASMFCLLRGGAMQVVSDLPLRFWLSKTSEVIMSLRQL